MKKTLNTKTALDAWKVLSSAKYAKMSDDDKIALWKISKALKPVSTGYDEDHKGILQTLKPTEDFDDKLMRWNETRDKKGAGMKDGLPMTDAEFVDFIYRFITPYNNSVEKAMKELESKKIELEYEPLSKDAFKALLNSNEWTMEQVTAIDFITE